MMPIAKAQYESTTIQRLVNVKLNACDDFALTMLRLGFCCCCRTKQFADMEEATAEKMEHIFDPVYPYLNRDEGIASQLPLKHYEEAIELHVPMPERKKAPPPPLEYPNDPIDSERSANAGRRGTMLVGHHPEVLDNVPYGRQRRSVIKGDAVQTPLKADASRLEDSDVVEGEGETRVQFEADRWGLSMLAKSETTKEFKGDNGVLFKERKYRVNEEDAVKTADIDVQLHERRLTQRISFKERGPTGDARNLQGFPTLNRQQTVTNRGIGFANV